MGCDKHAQGAPVEHLTNLAGKPRVLFLMFGDRSDARLLPVAMLAQGKISALSLDARGWRRFDEAYFQPGAHVALYRNGQPIPDVTVRRGMWSDREPLYTLPGCTALKPLAAADVYPSVDGTMSVELLALSDSVAAPAARAAPAPERLDSARAIAARVAEREGLSKGVRDGLDLAVQVISTGASSQPTYLASYMERDGAPATRGRHLFLIADSLDKGYAPTLVHGARDHSPEYRRLIDHLDLNGDGVDEIVLEGWRPGGDSYVLIMQYAGGKWREVARGTTSWCADPKPAPGAGTIKVGSFTLPTGKLRL